MTANQLSTYPFGQVKKKPTIRWVFLRKGSNAIKHGNVYEQMPLHRRKHPINQ